MKTLLLLRHAKSSWADTSLSDFERPLNDRGLRAARFMGELIAERELLPDRIVASPAKRAAETARLLASAASFTDDVSHDDRIYEASPRMLMQVVSEMQDDIGSVMLVGHNPGMEGFVRVLTGVTVAMPTGALAVIDLEIDRWSEAALDSGKLRKLLKPKEEMRAEP